MSRCGIVILAAGASSRMGVAKQSLEFEGSTLLARAVATAVGSTCRPIVVVLGARADELQKVLDQQPVNVAVNADWAAGMGTSIRSGMSAIIGDSLDAVMILLCDQPLISSAKLDEMVGQHFADSHLITAAAYADTLGTPVIFASSLFEELQSLEDAQGGKAIVNRHLNQAHGFDLPEAQVDVDTAEDFARLVQRRGQICGGEFQ